MEGAVAEQEEVVSGIQRLSVLHAKGTGVSDVVGGLRQKSVGMMDWVAFGRALACTVCSCHRPSRRHFAAAIVPLTHRRYCHADEERERLVQELLAAKEEVFDHFQPLTPNEVAQVCAISVLVAHLHDRVSTPLLSLPATWNPESSRCRKAKCLSGRVFATYQLLADSCISVLHVILTQFFDAHELLPPLAAPFYAAGQGNLELSS